MDSYSPWGRKELDSTERTHTHTHTHIHVLIWNFARFSKGTMIKSTPQPSDFNLQMMLTSVN